jgi:glycosyltransferase involved in cell wall biosynthesis
VDAEAPFTISVVIAVWNGEATIAEALASVLAQTLAPSEVIVVDDGSDDGTRTVVERVAQASLAVPVHLLRLDRNGGQAAALNHGIARAAGAYVAFLDADDVWMPDKLAAQVALFRAQPELDVVYGFTRQRWIGGAGGGREQAPVPAYLPGAMLIRRAALDRVGPFDPRWRLGSVVDWYARSVDARLAQQLVPGVVYERRVHGRNMGIVDARHRSDYLDVIKVALDRRRGRR